MTKKYIIMIADLIVKQANEDCYNMIELESIVEDWVQLFIRTNPNFSTSKFEEYVFSKVEGY